MDELEALRQKRLKEMQAQMGVQQSTLEQEDAQHAQALQQLESIALSALSTEARSRLNNIKLAEPQKYLQLLQLIVYATKGGQVQGKISDEQLKQLLMKIKESKREIKIIRK
ncbi:MAG: hypothetical protein GOV15_04495 [Candidatus Diapherotrites archaeon]|nr:hypothetical protein [Candidatus Diapherotrites archaeon]